MSLDSQGLLGPVRKTVGFSCNISDDVNFQMSVFIKVGNSV